MFVQRTCFPKAEWRAHESLYLVDNNCCKMSGLFESLLSIYTIIDYPEACKRFMLAGILPCDKNCQNDMSINKISIPSQT